MNIYPEQRINLFLLVVLVPLGLVPVVVVVGVLVEHPLVVHLAVRRLPPRTGASTEAVHIDDDLRESVLCFYKVNVYQNGSSDSYLLGEAIAVVAVLLRVVVDGGHVRHTAATRIFVGADEAQIAQDERLTNG